MNTTNLEFFWAIEVMVMFVFTVLFYTLKTIWILIDWVATYFALATLEMLTKNKERD
jgi:hypothetical protein